MAAPELITNIFISVSPSERALPRPSFNYCLFGGYFQEGDEVDPVLFILHPLDWHFGAWGHNVRPLGEQAIYRFLIPDDIGVEKRP